MREIQKMERETILEKHYSIFVEDDRTKEGKAKLDKARKNAIDTTLNEAKRLLKEKLGEYEYYCIMIEDN